MKNKIITAAIIIVCCIGCKENNTIIPVIYQNDNQKIINMVNNTLFDSTIISEYLVNNKDKTALEIILDYNKDNNIQIFSTRNNNEIDGELKKRLLILSHNLQ